ncbi:fasciclin domain-containing protein [Nocardioides lianchengensis]|uniref:Uncaracterized surface protein containing fasciclin (FAS1) repeats n=1 Tax=Nocardioides lianchengensis TaxID=1045774 RepID=A0A1G6L1C0_9ACTN|nr:fasciclin domain-containing protein [Nocardioides lianchengensis]NYG12721.1 putative surface protein with fasciclin (FAS1) repeats [Nocardioides lianchengensis]SDC36993.1 Uncaracterized surface protein containing fasciclin (FAS1) repeats [Nocardioides lianchengensis]
MKLQTLRRTGALATAAITLSVGLAACGSDDSSSTASDDTSSSSSSAPSEETSPSEDAGMTDAAADTYGPACGDIPTDDSAASFSGMAAEPVATAASANPLLSTLVEAVGVAGLGDALNSAEALTVFAPANPAFEAMDQATLEAAMKDPKLLGTVLSHHVVPERISPDQLSGEFETLAGDKLTIEGEGEEATIGTEGATVLCGNVQTANATVYIIDTVLMPAM